MNEGELEVEYSGSRDLVNAFFTACLAQRNSDAQENFDVGILEDEELRDIYVKTRCWVRDGIGHTRYLPCNEVLENEKGRIDIRIYSLIYRYAHTAAGRFLYGEKSFSIPAANPLLSDNTNLYKFLDEIKDAMAMVLPAEVSQEMRILLSRIIGILSRYTIDHSNTLLDSLRIICEEAWGDAMAEIRVIEERRRIAEEAQAVTGGEIVNLEAVREQEGGGKETGRGMPKGNLDERRGVVLEFPDPRSRRTG